MSAIWGTEAFGAERRPGRIYTVNFMDGTVQAFAGVTRVADVDKGVLSLYRRSGRGAVEVHLASLPLVNVRAWVKS